MMKKMKKHEAELAAQVSHLHELRNLEVSHLEQSLQRMQLNSQLTASSLQQQLVAEGDRNAVQGCEAALTGAAELGLAGVALAYATDFEVVADVSATAVVAAGLTFAAFLARRPELVSRPSSSSR